MSRRRHGAEALAELNHPRPFVLEAQRDVSGIPGIVGDLADVEDGAVSEDSLLDGSVVDDVARGGLDEALGSPHVIGHTIALGALPQVYVNVEHMVRRQFPDLLRDLRRDYPREIEAQILHGVVETIIDLHDDGVVTFSIGGGKFNIVATCHLERRRC
jgi:hypothetical protein